MRRFTRSPYERMMTERAKSRREKPARPLPRSHPCFGCGNYGMTCLLPCYRDMVPFRRKRSAG